MTAIVFALSFVEYSTTLSLLLNEILGGDIIGAVLTNFLFSIKRTGLLSTSDWGRMWRGVLITDGESVKAKMGSDFTISVETSSFFLIVNFSVSPDNKPSVFVSSSVGGGTSSFFNGGSSTGTSSTSSTISSSIVSSI